MRVHYFKKRYVRSWMFFTLLLMILFLNGCGTKMPLLDSQSQVNLQKESLVLFALELKNDYVPDYQPKASLIHFLNLDDEMYGKSFDAGEPVKILEDGGNFYLISANLKPGTYEFQQIACTATALLIRGNCIAYINSSFSLPESDIVYLGHIKAVNVKRTSSDEKWAGPLIPLIDQAATGFSGGTFKVSIDNAIEDDLMLFQEKFPDLKNYEIHYLAMDPNE